MNPCIEPVPSPGASASLLVLSEALAVMRQLMQRDPGCPGEAELLRGAAVAVVGQHDVEACFLFMHRGTELSCDAVAARAPGSGEVVCGLEAERDDMDECRSLAGQVVERGGSLRCSALARVPGQATQRWRPVLGHALEHAGTRVGVAMLRFATPDLEPWHDRLLGLFADLLGLRLVTARLLHRQRRALKSSERARDVSHTELQLERRRCADAQRLLHVQGQRISYQATHDVLTGLLNRRGLLCRLRDLVAKPAHAGSAHGVLYLDVDRFRLVNDACGHLVGDHLMKQTGRVIAAHLRGDEVGGRMGNDVFAVLLPGHSRAPCLAKAAELREAVANMAFAHPGPPLDTTVSIGLTTFTGHDLGAEEIFRQARVACSFAYLRDLPVDLIKIEGEFVRAMAANTISASLVRTINQLGHELGLLTVAESVDSESVLESLREVGVDYAQGFLLGDPAPLSVLTRAAWDYGCRP